MGLDIIFESEKNKYADETKIWKTIKKLSDNITSSKHLAFKNENNTHYHLTKISSPKLKIKKCKNVILHFVSDFFVILL